MSLHLLDSALRTILLQMMDETKSRHKIPSSYAAFHRKHRSRSVDNTLTDKPMSKRSNSKEANLSTVDEVGHKETTHKETNVANIIKQFEQLKPTKSVQLNAKLDSSSLPTACTNARMPPSKKLQTTTTIPNSTENVLLHSQSCVLVSSTSEKPTDHRSYSISRNKNSNAAKKSACIQNKSSNIASSCNVRDERTKSVSMATIQENPQHETFIKSQSNDDLNISHDDLSMLSAILPFQCNSSNIVSTNKVTFVERKEKLVLFKSLEEIHQTEVKYIRKLYVLSFKVPKIIARVCEHDENLLDKFNSIYNPILNIIKRLYHFHYESIVPHMEQCLTGHRNSSIWSIFEKHFQTIENLYKEYYIVYDENQKKLERFCSSSSLIQEAMLKCQGYLGNLYPIAELNCANQHLLRYILLIKNYMKNFNEDSNEHEHMRFIHDELTSIAERCDEYLATSLPQFNKLKARLDTKLECIEKEKLIWHGSLRRWTMRRNSEIVPSYIIILSESILICEEAGNKLELKRQSLIKNIKVEIVENERIVPTTFTSNNSLSQFNSITYYPFRINTGEKSYEFLTEKETEREKWMRKLFKSNEHVKHQTSPIQIRQLSHRQLPEEEIGVHAPIWTNDNDVTRCQICHNHFDSNSKASRRHHCRSCGFCVCSSCSVKRMTLRYCQQQGDVRVCDKCYTQYTGVPLNQVSSQKVTRDPNKTILFGDFYFLSLQCVIWIELQEDFHLHIYGGKLDQVENFAINLSQIQGIVFVQETQTFVLSEDDNTYRLSLRFNHHITYNKNDFLDHSIKHAKDKLGFYANLWHDTLQLARLKITPLWYTRKRDSSDSGISNV